MTITLLKAAQIRGIVQPAGTAIKVGDTNDGESISEPVALDLIARGTAEKAEAAKKI